MKYPLLHQSTLAILALFVTVTPSGYADTTAKCKVSSDNKSISCTCRQDSLFDASCTWAAENMCTGEWWDANHTSDWGWFTCKPKN